MVTNTSESTGHCHKSDCSFLRLDNFSRIDNVPPLRPNPELSGIGVILGFSLSAYLTLLLLVIHYVVVHDFHRTDTMGEEYTNPIDYRVLYLLRKGVVTWKPSRRFAYAMEKSVLILCDLNLVTGLAVLIAGYSQLECGISAYHWEIMVFIAWFASFSFIAACSFLEDFFRENSTMRLIRLCFMFVFASLLIIALLPTGSAHWLNQYNDKEGFYPSLGASCFFVQLGMPHFVQAGPKIWSMAFSLFVVTSSYISCGIRLFRSSSDFSRRWLREWPGVKVKALLYYLEQRALGQGLSSRFWIPPYLFLYMLFIAVRAFVDVGESMLSEILWLGFAICWATVKVWTTRAISGYTYNGAEVFIDPSADSDNSWTFGQTLPLILLLLPLLSMAQTYLDDEAKAEDLEEPGHGQGHALDPDHGHGHQHQHHHHHHHTQHDLEKHDEKHCQPSSRPVLTGSSSTSDAEQITWRDFAVESTSCTVCRCSHHGSVAPNQSIHDTLSHQNSSSTTASRLVHRARMRLHSFHGQIAAHPNPDVARPGHVPLVRHPYPSFQHHPWYTDQIFLMIDHIIMIAVFVLWIFTYTSNVLGISAILQSRLFLIWIFGIAPSACLIHLAFWYVAAFIITFFPWVEGWLKNKKVGTDADTAWWRRVTVGNMVYWSLRIMLVWGLCISTFFLAVEIAGPQEIQFGSLN